MSDGERGELYVIITIDHYDNEVSILGVSAKPLSEITVMIDAAFIKYKKEWDDKWGVSEWVTHKDETERQSKCDDQGYNHLYKIIKFTLDDFGMLDFV